MDATEGAKFLYYLPFGCSITQWVSVEEAAKDRGPVMLAAQKLGQTVETVKCRASGTPRLEPFAFDACISIGAVGRAGKLGGVEAAATSVNAALQALKPQGRFFLVEGDPKFVEPLLAAALDENEFVDNCTATVEDDAIICVVTTRSPKSEDRSKGMAAGIKKRR